MKRIPPIRLQPPGHALSQVLQPQDFHLLRDGGRCSPYWPFCLSCPIRIDYWKGADPTNQAFTSLGYLPVTSSVSLLAPDGKNFLVLLSCLCLANLSAMDQLRLGCNLMFIGRSRLHRGSHLWEWPAVGSGPRAERDCARAVFHAHLQDWSDLRYRAHEWVASGSGWVVTELRLSGDFYIFCREERERLLQERDRLRFYTYRLYYSCSRCARQWHVIRNKEYEPHEAIDRLPELPIRERGNEAGGCPCSLDTPPAMLHGFDLLADTEGQPLHRFVLHPAPHKDLKDFKRLLPAAFKASFDCEACLHEDWRLFSAAQLDKANARDSYGVLRKHCPRCCNLNGRVRVEWLSDQGHFWPLTEALLCYTYRCAEPDCLKKNGVSEHVEQHTYSFRPRANAGCPKCGSVSSDRPHKITFVPGIGQQPRVWPRRELVEDPDDCA